MALFGSGFRASLRASTYRPYNPAGLKAAIVVFLVLFIVNQVILQGVFAAGIAALGASDRAAFMAGVPRGGLLALLPASLLSAVLAWILARRKGADARDVLALRAPALGLFGWLTILACFLLFLYSASFLIALLFGIDDKSSGLVEQTVIRLKDDSFYAVIAAGLVIGAPVAEELIFRGQIFAALSQTRIGFVGSAIVTSAMWAALHITEPIHLVAVIFLMGLALSWLLIRFGSLWVTIACHSAWNAMSALVLYSMAPR